LVHVHKWLTVNDVLKDSLNKGDPKLTETNIQVHYLDGRKEETLYRVHKKSLCT
jgi:hypothetical protein